MKEKNIIFKSIEHVIDHGEDGFAAIVACNSIGLKIIVSWGEGWEHVSVSKFTKQCPTWYEMCFIKDLIWNANECVVQFHPPDSQYVNCHKFCLHLWKPIGVEIQTPPTWMIG